jgi:hypothetical protein
VIVELRKVSNFSSIECREQATFRSNNDDDRFVQVVTETSQCVYVSLHVDTLLRLKANQSLLLFHKAVMLRDRRRKNKYMYQYYSLWFDSTEARTHDIPLYSSRAR